MIKNKIKQVMNAAGLLLVIAGLIFIFFALDAHTITSNAVHDIVNKNGAISATMIVLVTALIIGMFTYMTLGFVPSIAGDENYYTKSKYWAGCAVQKIKWASKKKKEKREVVVEMQKNCNADEGSSQAKTKKTQIQEPKKLKPQAARLFESVAKEMDRLEEIKKVNILQEEQKAEEKSTEKEDKNTEVEEKKTKLEMLLEEDKKDKDKNNKNINNKETVEQISKKIVSMFGTDNPLRVAEQILRRRNKGGE